MSSSKCFELVKVFDYHRIGKSPAVFDYTKLRWMNGEYLRRMDPEKFYEKALPYLRKVIHKNNLDLKTIAELVRTRIEIFPDMEEMVSFFEELPEYSADLFENKKQKAETKSNKGELSADSGGAPAIIRVRGKIYKRRAL